MQVNNITEYSASDKWLIDLLRIAAKNDNSNPSNDDNQLLIQCIGAYEENGASWTDFTTSWHANYYHNNTPVWCKVDWRIEDRDGEKSAITFSVYCKDVANADDWDNTHTFSDKLYDGDSVTIEISGNDFGYGSSRVDTLRLTDTVDIHIESFESYGGEEPTNDVSITCGSSRAAMVGVWGISADDIIDEIINKIVRTLDNSYAPSGWIPNSFYAKNTYYNENTEDEPGMYSSITIDATYQLWGQHTDKHQIYTRQYLAYQPNEIKLKVNKSILDVDKFSSEWFKLPEYNLKGTTFTLYDSPSSSSPITDTDGNDAVFTIPDVKGGESNELKLGAEWANKTVYLEETLPKEATGFEHKERIEVELPNAGQSKSIDVENTPVICPVRLIVKKESALTKGVPIADIDFNGIEYALVYYGNQENSESNAHSNSGAVNTWKFTTKELNDLGYIDFQNGSYKSGGDSLYYYNDEIRYPLGWYRLYESSSVNSMQDKGLEVNSEPFYMHAYLDPTTNIRKVDYWQGDKQLTSEEYPETSTLIHDHEATIDEQEHWERFGFVKTDILLNSEGPEGDTEFEGAVFTVYSEDSNRFKGSQTYDGHTYSIGSGNVVLVDSSPLTITIDSNGKGICEYPLPKTDNVSGKRFYIMETKVPEGYKEAAKNIKYYVDYQDRMSVSTYNKQSLSYESKDLYANTTKTQNNIYTVKADNSVTIDSVDKDTHNADKSKVFNSPRKGQIDIIKSDDDYTDRYNDRYAQGDATLAGIEFAIVNVSKHAISYYRQNSGSNSFSSTHSVDIAPGNVVAIITTDSEGNASCKNLPYGTYKVYELSQDNTLRQNSTYSHSSAVRSKYANPGYIMSTYEDGNYVGEAEIHPDDDSNTSTILSYDVDNSVARGTIDIQKFDKQTQSTKYNGTYQGDTDFSGIRYAIVNRSKQPVKIDGVIYPVGTVIGILTANRDGYCAYDYSGDYSIPYGTYDIYELRVDASIEVGDVYDGSPNLGESPYANDNGYMYTEDPTNTEDGSKNSFTISKRNQAVRLDELLYNITFTNVTAKGTINVQKKDGDLSSSIINQGDETLAGIKYAVINRSNRFIVRNGVVFEKNEIVDIKATDSNGVVHFDADNRYTFPYGTYEVVELRLDNTLAIHDVYDNCPEKHGTSPLANNKYVFTEDKTVAEVGANTTYNVEPRDDYSFRTSKETDNEYFTNYSVKGTVEVHKEDVETVWAQGDEDFANIRYAIVNRSSKAIERDTIYTKYLNHELAGKTMFEPGEVVDIIVTDHDGIAKLDEPGMFTLPYGTYEIIELRLDSTILAGDNYDNSTDKYGTSIYANDTGMLFTGNVAITQVDSTTSDKFTMASQTDTHKNTGENLDLKYTFTNTFKNAPAKGTLTLIKYDANLTDNPITDDSNKEYRSGDADTEGIRYAIVNISTDPITGEPRKVMYKNVIYNPNSVIDIITVTKENDYEARLDEEGHYSLNYGTYRVYELRKDCTLNIGEDYPVDNPKDPRLGTSIYSNDRGYLHNDKSALDKSALVEVTVTKNDADGHTVYTYVDENDNYEVEYREPVIHAARTRFDYSFMNYPSRSELLITKYDDESDMQKNQGNNKFVGIRFAIVNKSAVHVYYTHSTSDNYIYEPGEIIDVVELGEDGNVRLIDVPYGTYDIYELRRDSTLEPHDIYPTKETDATYSKLGTSIYANTYYTYCDDVIAKAIEISSVPPDYSKSPNYTVEAHIGSQIREAGETYVYKFSDMPIRSDFEHQKYDIDGNRVPFIPFAVSLLDDNGEILETHVIITDKNGYLNTSTRPRNPETVNSLDKYYDTEHERYTGPLDEAAGEVNIWFGNIEDYISEDIIANNRGVLLAGSYYIQELYCENNYGQDMLRHSFDAFEERVVNRPENVAIDLNIIMDSDAYDYGTNSKTLSIGTEADIKDVVGLVHLKTYNTYKLITEAVNIRKDGSWVSLGYSDPFIFTPEPYDETMTTYVEYEVKGTFDTSSAEPGTYVGLIDRLYELVDGRWTDQPIRVHNGDLSVESQKLLVPELSSRATNLETGNLIGSIEPNTAASDKIIYKYLGDKSVYNIEVSVVNESRNVIKDVNGKDCIQNYFLFTNDAVAHEVQQVANNAFTSPTSGEISMSDFSLDPFIIGDDYDTVGMVLKMYDVFTGELVLSHNVNMDEAAEILKYLRIHTTVTDVTGYQGIVPYGEDVEVIDNIYYDNLVQNTDIMVMGAIVDKETGDIITTSTGFYTLTEGDGEIALSFNFNSTGYAGKQLVVFERVYLQCDDRNVLISKHEDLEDKNQTIGVPDVHTELLNVHNGDGYKIVSTVENTEVTLTDYVEYTNLIPGDQWVLHATLMNAATGEPILDAYGDEVTTDHIFVPTASSGEEAVEFTFMMPVVTTDWEEDLNWVCFEEVLPGTEGRDDLKYAVHADLEDKNQTLFIPKFRTTAVNKETNDHIIKAAPNQTIVDTVEFRNFVAAVDEGQEFTLVIEAHDAATGDIILDSEGNPYSNSKLFIWNGQVTEDIEITIDTSNLSGKTIVFYETLYYGNSTNPEDKVLVEDDKDSPEQSVMIPDVHTLATDTITNTRNVSLNRIIEDKIMLDGIRSDTDYIIRTMIVDKETGEFIKTSDGYDYTAITNYHSPENTTSTTLTIDLDIANTEDILGKDIVLFEYVYMADTNTKFEDLNDENIVVAHTDINDINQTLEVPDLHTTAFDAADMDNIIDGTSTQETIIDTVTYTNLIVGNTYTVTGKLAVKTEDGSEEYVVDENGDIITSSVTFTAETSNGFIDVPFTFNASNYAGKNIVVFESLTDNDVEWVIHADIDDEEQTVFVSLLLHVSIAKADFDDVGYFLKGAEITIFNDDGSIATDIYGNECVGLTDENGSVDFVVMYKGTNLFYAQETAAPEGYELNEEKFPVSPTDDREALGTDLIKINILDEVIIIPPTGDINLAIVFIILGVGILGLSSLLIHKKHKKNK